MVDELSSIEQLERIKDMVQKGYNDLAVRTIEIIVSERKARVEQFEKDLFDNMPV